MIIIRALSTNNLVVIHVIKYRIQHRVSFPLNKFLVSLRNLNIRSSSDSVIFFFLKRFIHGTDFLVLAY